MEDIAVDRRAIHSRLLAAQTANAVGDGGFYVTSALFLSQVAGLRPAQIGTGLTIAWAAGFALATPVGQVADRVGLRRAGVGLSLLTALSLAGIGSARSMPWFVAVTVMYAVAQSGSSAVRQALLVTLVPPPDRVLVRAHVQAAVNMGLGAGAALGGVALLMGTTGAYLTIFALDALSFGAAAWLVSRLPDSRRPAPAAAARPAGQAVRGLAVLADRPYLAAAALNAVLYLYMPMLGVLLPLYLVRATAAPAWSIGAVFVLNTTGVALLQVRAARRVVDPDTAATAIRRAGGALLLACLAFATTAHTASTAAAVAVLIVAVVLQILGEVLLASGSWEIGFALADPHHQGQWQSLFSSGIPLARALGPVALTTLVLTWDGPGWLVLGLLFAAAALLMAPVVTWAARTHPDRLGVGGLHAASDHERCPTIESAGSLDATTTVQPTKG